MTDSEIKIYLEKHHYSIPAQEGIMKIFNRSYQIIDSEYDPDTRMMTILTPDNTFTFEWILNKIS